MTNLGSAREAAPNHIIIHVGTIPGPFSLTYSNLSSVSAFVQVVYETCDLQTDSAELGGLRNIHSAPAQ